MKNLPDHGKAFWDMFPSDGNGDIFISEISSGDAPTQQPKEEAGITAESAKITAA